MVIVLLFLDLSSCGPAALLKVIYFVKILLEMVLFIVPIGLILFISIDFAKAMISSNSSEQSKTVNIVIKRIVYAMVLFLVPSIVAFMNSMLGEVGVNYSKCYDNLVLDEIKHLSTVEFTCEQAEYYVLVAEKKLTKKSVANAQKYVDKVLDEEIKKQLQERLDIANKLAIEKEKEREENVKIQFGNKKGTALSYDGISSSGNCNPGSAIRVLNSEPDPSCAINYLKNYLNKDNFIYPKKDGAMLGAWPKDYKSIPTQLSSMKKYKSGSLIWPNTPINGLYNWVYNHNGIDIMAPVGTPIYSPVSGNLVYSEWGRTTNTGSDETAYSVTITMDNPIKYAGKVYDTVFLTHMSGIVNRCATNKCNKKVKMGELLGFVGNAAGTASSSGVAPHLHMSIYPASSYSSGLKTLIIQDFYDIKCGSSCKNISIKAGG